MDPFPRITDLMADYIEWLEYFIISSANLFVETWSSGNTYFKILWKYFIIKPLSCDTHQIAILVVNQGSSLGPV